MKKRIIYIDMDDTLCHFMTHYKAIRKSHGITFPQGKEGFWLSLPPIKGAVEAVKELRSKDEFDVYILTAPSVRNPHSYMEKRQWIEKYFDYDFCKKLIISPNKALLKGDVLIDDNIQGKGQEDFEGELIKFASEKYPDWSSVLGYLDLKF